MNDSLNNIGYIEPLNLVRIYQSPFLCKTEYEKRTWKDRLFSWPWRPWVKFNKIVIPDEDLYRISSQKFICHPKTYRKLIDRLNEDTGIRMVAEAAHRKK